MLVPEGVKPTKFWKGLFLFLIFYLFISQLYDNLSGFKPVVYGLIGGGLVVALDLFIDGHETISPQPSGLIKGALVKINSKIGDNTYLGELISTYEQFIVTCDKELEKDEMVCIQDIKDKIIVEKIIKNYE